VKYVIRGTVVTMDSRRGVLKDAWVGIDGQAIKFVKHARYKLPKEFDGVPVVNVEGYIYPGLIDLHNHLAYNFLKLWKIEKTFVDRYQWSGIARYNKEITMPMKLVTSTNPVDLVKYAEIKALVGGVTTIAGFAKFNKSYAAWLLRNIEVERFGNQEAPIYTSVLKLRDEKAYLDTAKKMAKGNAFFYHLAEGTRSKILVEYEELDKYGLVKDKLVAIHCTALSHAHFEKMGKKDAKIVWSPLSNFLLYKATTDVVAAKKNGVLICLGSDWSPSGSKNLLWELKVANIVNQESLGQAFSRKNLVEMVTVNPAKAIGWDDRVGRVLPGHMADLVVFERRDGDPYRNLVLSTEKDLKLSILGGKPRYGDPSLLKKLGIKTPETITVAGKKRGLDMLEPGVQYGDITFKAAKSNLLAALSRPAEAAKKLFDKFKRMKRGDVPLRLIPLEEEEEITRPLLAAKSFNAFRAKNSMAGDGTVVATELDTLAMYDDKDFFITLKNNPNVPHYLMKLEDYVR
jgi:cytosine/adenosine deaminase-related metal-dependent hydrolase